MPIVHGVKLLSFVEVLVCAFYTPMSACFARWACAWGGFQTLTTVTCNCNCMQYACMSGPKRTGMQMAIMLWHNWFVINLHTHLLEV